MNSANDDVRRGASWAIFNLAVDEAIAEEVAKVGYVLKQFIIRNKLRLPMSLVTNVIDIYKKIFSVKW